ncbi:NADPH-dependent FMN reductase [Parafilimonas sp.]|uniref:NADPH-dependent FMN reductase n=1 Tax=Parafilimonas sp. TaxID=1969739 RepID=UPI0039E2DFF1
MNIEIVSGSPRLNSVTHRLVLHLKKHLPAIAPHHVNVIDVRDWELNVLQQEIFKSVDTAPVEFKPLAQRMFDADAFIIVTPEYNGSYTPAVKNLFDHFPKQSRKPFGIVTASPGALGGIRAGLQVQLLIYALFGVGSPHMLVTPFVDKKFDEEGNLLDASFQKNIDVFVAEFLWLAGHITAGSKTY